MTDKMYTNTRIPRSFELTVGSHKFWVHPNATKHMFDYITKTKPASHGIPMNSQTLLTSFKNSLEKAIERVIPYNIDRPVVIDCWDFLFSQPRSKGLLPVIYHANYIP